MARIRTIKPEFWTNEELAETSEAARLLAIGLLNHSDDEGYFKAHQSLIKAVVFPLTEPSMSIHECLKQLSIAGYLRLFKGSDGKEYGKVINFESHQRVNRPTESKIKKLDTFTECSLKTHGKLTEDSPPERKGKEQGKEGTNVPPDGGTSDYTDEFEQAWKAYPKRHTSSNKKATYKQWKARLNNGFTVEDMTQGIERYFKFCKAEGQLGTKFVKMPETFLGPNEHFMEEWTVSESGGYDPMARDTSKDEEHLEFQKELLRMTRQ